MCPEPCAAAKGFEAGDAGGDLGLSTATEGAFAGAVSATTLFAADVLAADFLAADVFATAFFATVFLATAVFVEALVADFFVETVFACLATRLSHFRQDACGIETSQIDVHWPAGAASLLRADVAPLQPW
jgi:hypothetical protein